MNVRRRGWVRGLVQGVGFRPYVHRLATRLGLTGFVKNQASRVLIEVEGTAASIAEFKRALMDGLPPPARRGRGAVR